MENLNWFGFWWILLKILKLQLSSSFPDFWVMVCTIFSGMLVLIQLVCRYIPYLWYVGKGCTHRGLFYSPLKSPTYAWAHNFQIWPKSGQWTYCYRKLIMNYPCLLWASGSNVQTLIVEDLRVFIKGPKNSGRPCLNCLFLTKICSTFRKFCFVSLNSRKKNYFYIFKTLVILNFKILFLIFSFSASFF